MRFVRQTNEVVNTAVLTGVLQSYAMTVYSVSHAGHVADVTSQATCHAGDADVLQVISHVYSTPVDRTELSLYRLLIGVRDLRA